MQTWENTKQEQQQQEYKDVEARSAWARALKGAALDYLICTEK